MTKRNIAAALLLFVFTFATGCQQTAAPSPTPSPTVQVTPTPEPTPEPTPQPDPAAVQLSTMTTAEKVGQLFIVGFEGTTVGEDAAAYLRDYRVGGVILFKRNIESAEQLVALNNSLKELNRGSIPLFVSVDQEGGVVDRMPPEVSRTPRALTVGGAESAQLSFELGSLLAAECGAFGFNLDFAPVLDVWSNPQNTVIGNRAFGSDAAAVAERAPLAAYGLMSAGVIPVVKHFPGHGDTAVDSHVGLPIVNKSLEGLMEGELLPFRSAIDAAGLDGFYADMDTRVPAVMVGHILLSQLDPDRPASLSPIVVDGLLRDKLGFEGVVFTDDLTMGAVVDNYGLGEAAVLAVEAGCDGLLVCHQRENVDEAYAAVLEAAESGRIPQARLDESVYRMLRLKQAYNLADDPVESPDLEELNARIAWLEEQLS